ncbi:MAG: ATP-binding protein, partial [Planctomycetaceae bacterium]
MEVTDTLLANLDQLGSWGLLTTDKDMVIVGWNRWLEKYSGRSASELIGQHLFHAFPSLVERGFDGYYDRALEGQAAMLSQRFHKYLLPLPPTVANSSLTQMQQTARISPVMQGDQVCGTFTLVEDVTERVHTEQELREQAARLEEANRHKDEFLAMLAHELRNPLAPIRNGIRILDVVKSESPEGQQTREMMERQVSHMSRLIDDLLDVSRIVRGKVHLQKELCDLVALVRQVTRDFEPIFADHGVRLAAELPRKSCWIAGDPIRLYQIVSNLLNNACKFTDHGGEVRLTVTMQPEDNQVRLEISDTGIGMSNETVAKVFDAFSQAESSLARSKGGLGLGLALVKGFTGLHDGSVEAYSAGIGLGSTFTIVLPMTKDLPASQHTVATPGIDREVKRVLIIEDNRDTASTLSMLLKHL